MDRPSGAYIQDPETGAITPDLSDEAMKNRQPADDQGQSKEAEGKQPDKGKRR